MGYGVAQSRGNDVDTLCRSCDAQRFKYMDKSNGKTKHLRIIKEQSITITLIKANTCGKVNETENKAKHKWNTCQSDV